MVLSDRRVRVQKGDLVRVTANSSISRAIVERLFWNCGTGNRMRWWVTIRDLQTNVLYDFYLSDLKRIKV